MLPAALPEEQSPSLIVVIDYEIILKNKCNFNLDVMFIA